MSTNGNRNGGWAAVLGGAALGGLFTLLTLGAVGAVPSLKVLEDKHWFFHMFEAPIMALLTLGVWALYRHQLGSFGKLGKAGAYLALFGYGAGALGGLVIIAVELGSGASTAEGTLDLLAHLPSYFPQVFGTLLFGVATLRARTLPRAAAWVLTVAGAAQLLVTFSPAPQVVRLLPLLGVCLGWALLGYALAAGRRERAERPALAAA